MAALVPKGIPDPLHLPGDIIHGGESIIKGATGAATNTGKLFSDLTSPHFWLRVVEVGGGFLLVTIALVSMMKGQSPQSAGKQVTGALQQFGKTQAAAAKSGSVPRASDGGGTAKRAASLSGKAVRDEGTAAAAAGKATATKAKAGSDAAKAAKKTAKKQVAKKAVEAAILA